MARQTSSPVKSKSARLDDKIYKKAASFGRVAARLFNQNGYVETTLEDIAAAAKASKGAIYHYFSSKDELLFFILDNYLDVVLEDFEEKVKAIQEPMDKIRFIIQRHIGLYSEHSAAAKTLLHDAHCLPAKYAKIISKKERTYFETVKGALATLFEADVPHERLTALTFILFGMCNWIYAWYNPKGPISPQELSDIIFRIFLFGVLSFGDSSRCSPGGSDCVECP